MRSEATSFAISTTNTLAAPRYARCSSLRSSQVIVNKNFEEKEATIMVDASPKKMNVWNDWFMKWHDLEVRGLEERSDEQGNAIIRGRN